ncbi:conserved hypothetical protein [Mucor ambiguus]|uniref:Karyogamy protein n=1 Tax=Mucor ambiguus TaxID=91626 RepID=A0A0C9MJN3_9FUNG|nr:conserved hypothetical protein [Mucor ambiguus]
MITSESIQTTEANDIFDPLYQIQIPEKELNDLFLPSLSPEQRVNDFQAVTKRITHWLETAHMIAFSIEQSVKRGDMESYSVEPLQLACNKMHPLIPLLTECIDEQDELEHCRLPVTKIQSEWSGLQHFISFVKTLIEEANEKHMLRTMMENILIQVDDLSMMIFQFQEKRHSDPEKKEDSILLDIDNRVGPLFTNVEKVYTRMTSSNPPEDTTGLLTRKHLLVQERWESLRIEIDELKIELKEDRWLVVFRQVADQVDDMMNGLDKTVTQCYTMIQQIKDGHAGMVTSSSSTTSSSSSNHTSNTSSTTTDARTKLRSVEKNFEAKYKYYTPSITKMLLMLGNGIAARVSRNVATLQRHEAMLARWNTLKSTMDQLRKRDLPDIVVVEPTLSDNTHCWSRLSDRSDSTTGSNNWKDLISGATGGTATPTSTSRFLHNKPSSPSLHFEDDRSKSPFKFNHHSPSPLFMEEKVRQYRGTSPNGRRTTSPSFYARESFNSVGSALRPQSISPSHSKEDDMISTKDFRSQNNNSRQQTTNNHTTSRSITPSIRRSGTPSMIPRPKTPTSNALRPRSSMARITNMTRSESPFRSSTSSTTRHNTTSTATTYRPDPKDPLDKQVALIVNRSPIPIQCSKKAGTADGRYYFGNELTPSLGGADETKY